MPRAKPTAAAIAARFWGHVEKHDGEDACWTWAAWRDGDGYGRFYVDRRRRWYAAHRFALELALGRELAPGECALHGCHNPPCVRHVRLGTQAENIRERQKRQRQARGERNGRAKLTTEAVLACRRRYALGENCADLAREAGLAYKSMRDALTGANWRHLAAEVAS